MIGKTFVSALAGVALAAAFAMPASADAVEDFYKGKTVTLLVGFGAGGGYDVYARSVAEVLTKHIPGNPNVITQFMPGGGSLKASNHLFNVSPKDGSVIGMHSPVLPVFQLIRKKGFKLDVRKFNYIGRIATMTHVLMVRGDKGVKGIDQAKATQLQLAESGKGSPTYIYPTMMNRLLGTKFRLVSGYRGSAASKLALERGEVDGFSSSWVSWKVSATPWIKSGFIVPLVVVATEHEADTKGIPLVTDLATNEDDKQIVEFIASSATIGRTIVAPPGVPAERIAALRKAFEATMKDPAFAAIAAQRKIDYDFMPGEKLQARVQRTVSISPALAKKAQEVLGYK
jgi:tripartite-type tricarboxylate transporter receptor subunit TctC